MKTVFLDTAGLIALWNEDDQWNRAATGGYERAACGSARLVTTPFVLLECSNAAARKSYRQAVVDLRRRLLPAGDLIEPTPAELEAAWSEYSKASAGGPGIIDLVSFAIMRRLGITEAFTNDRHFAAAGFQTLF